MTPSSQSAISAVCHLLMGDPVAVPTKSWHSLEHTALRETVQQLISYLISQRRPSASIEWLARLPEVSKRIERRLYLSAKSVEEYVQSSLLNRREI
jgi:response regulator RpfG family c-di-GMP phosphodiesterase